MANGFRMTGPACCCCKNWVRYNEHRVWNDGYNGAMLITEADPDPANPRVTLFSNDGTPDATLNYQLGTMGLDWKRKRIYYSYILNDRPMGSIVDQDTVFKWWDGKSSGSAVGTAVTTLGSYLVDAFATDADNEHIYLNGHDYPYPDYSATWSVDFKRMDYDGSNLTTLDTLQVFRTGGSVLQAGVSSMLVYRPGARLYYVKRHNIGTSTANDWLIELCYRDFADFTTEVVIYSVVSFSTVSGGDAVRLLNCLSFDLTDEKIYWVEHSFPGGGSNRQSNVYRADLDGSNLETLYASADPYSVNFVRYSNSGGIIHHEDFDRVVGAPRDGLYLREKDWTLIEQIGTIDTSEVQGSPFPAPTSSFLWCGYEGGTA